LPLKPVFDFDYKLKSFPKGTKYFYTTYGFTLLSAVLEKCSNEDSFQNLLLKFFEILGLNETYIDENDPLIMNRSK
jgi:serine beta-lactamase-like protein LACTB, mitochondrial